MAIAFHRTLPSLWGWTRFFFQSDGALVRVDLDTDDGPSSSGRAPKGVPSKADLGQWLRAFLSATPQDFPGAWVMPGPTVFSRRVYEATAAIPRGQVVTYGALASSAGSPKAARAVGTCMAQNPLPLLVPCHRVLASQGLGGFSGGGLPVKLQLLHAEGWRLES